MALSWSARRQLLYYAVGTVVLGILLLLGWQLFLTQAPSCQDGRQNGSETGVDCGGSCMNICLDAARAPTVEWARAYRTGSQTYTAAAYVQNPNPGAGARSVRYTFQLYDDKNILVVEKEGTTDLPPFQTVPVVEPNINVGNRTVARALFSFTSTPAWSTVLASQLPALRIVDQTLEASGERLSATIVNDSPGDVRRLAVVAVLFDTRGTAIAASKTVFDRIARGASQPVVFTWPGGVTGIARAEITVLPSF